MKESTIRATTLGLLERDRVTAPSTVSRRAGSACLNASAALIGADLVLGAPHDQGRRLTLRSRCGRYWLYM